MLDLDMFGEPEKLTYMAYFFPIISSSIIYIYHTSTSNLILLILTISAVILMESYHLAYKAAGGFKERKQLVSDLKNLGLKGRKQRQTLKFLFRLPLFFVFVILWNVMYFWNLIKLFKFLNEKIFLFVFLAQIGLYVFTLLQIAFVKRMMSGKLN